MDGCVGVCACVCGGGGGGEGIGWTRLRKDEWADEWVDGCVCGVIRWTSLRIDE